jgi:hypothetical protein
MFINFKKMVVGNWKNISLDSWILDEREVGKEIS